MHNFDKAKEKNEFQYTKWQKGHFSHNVQMPLCEVSSENLRTDQINAWHFLK